MSNIQSGDEMALRSQASPVNVLKRAWERIAPLQLADHSWDNVGIMIESPVANPKNRQVLLTIDLTTKVCEEALALPSCGVIVSYHPPIFRGLKSFTLADPLQSSLLRLSASGISVFSPHTSLDATPNGINSFLIRPFLPFASGSRAIVPSEKAPEGWEEAGMGQLVSLKEKLRVSKVVEMVKDHLRLSHVQLATPNPEGEVSSIAVCAGSGGSVFKGVKADLLLTGEMSHHEVLAAVANHQSVILTNHSNSERPYLDAVLREWLQKELNSEEKDGGEWEVVALHAASMSPPILEGDMHAPVNPILREPTYPSEVKPLAPDKVHFELGPSVGLAGRR